MFVYLYIHNKYTQKTQILCKQKLYVGCDELQLIVWQHDCVVYYSIVIKYIFSLHFKNIRLLEEPFAED